MFNTIKMIDFATPLPKRLEMRNSCGPYEWTPARAGTQGRGFYMALKGFEMDRHGSTLRLRIEPANDHLRGRLARINGYYCDDNDIDILQPIIARLPHGRGFLAGWTMGQGMCACIDRAIYDDVEGAASGAHSIAERDAENSRLADAEEREAMREEEDEE